jgi:tRNA pseudouridine(38-40) synthase
MPPKVRGTVYCCQASAYKSTTRTYDTRTYEDNAHTGTDDMILIKVRGQGFLLHQIRLMVGTAVLVARGKLPEEVRVVCSM